MKKAVAVMLLCISMLTLLAGCGDSYSAYDLQEAKERYASGKYTREDEIMVEGFNKWKADQDKYID